MRVTRSKWCDLKAATVDTTDDLRRCCRERWIVSRDTSTALLSLGNADTLFDSSRSMISRFVALIPIPWLRGRPGKIKGTGVQKRMNALKLESYR